MASFAQLTSLHPERILLRAPNWLGDCVMAVPALRAVREQFPQAHLTIAARGILPKLFAEQSYCDEAMAVPRGPWREGQSLRPGAHDLCVLFTNSLSTALAAFLSRTPVRVGYARDLRSVLLTHRVQEDEALQAAHQIHFYLRLALVLKTGDPAPPVTDPQQPPLPVVEITEPMLAGARALLQQAGIDPDSRPFVMAPGTAQIPAKRWPEEHYAVLARRLQAETGRQTILVGAPADTETCAQVAALAEGSAVSLCGQTSLPDLMGTLRLAAAYVGNDSGASHLAAAIGTPTAVLFGPTSMARTVPVGPRVSALHLGLDCAPCLKRVCPLGHGDCLRGLTPERVLATIVNE
jgi:heptosyltransferase-2